MFDFPAHKLPISLLYLFLAVGLIFIVSCPCEGWHSVLIRVSVTWTYRTSHI